MPILQCITGPEPIGDEVAYDLGTVTQGVLSATIPVGGQTSTTGSSPILDLLITNPLSDPIIVDIMYRAPALSLIDPTNSTDYDGVSRLTEFRYSAGGPVLSGNYKIEEMRDLSVSLLTIATFDQLFVTHRVELAGGASEAAEINDFLDITGDGVPPGTVNLFNQYDYFITATGWLKQP